MGGGGQGLTESADILLEVPVLNAGVGRGWPICAT